MNKYATDWKLLGGFSALLILILVIGLIGIFKIQALSRTVDSLGRRYLPMQRAILEMRINNNLYAMGIRNYINWKGSRYLEAAGAAVNLAGANKAAREFDRQLNIYFSGAGEKEQKEWKEKIVASEKEFRQVGTRIIAGVDKNADSGTINKLVMTFESRLYKIDDFLSATLQKASIKAVEEQMLVTDAVKKRAILFLGWSLLLAVAVGGQTAWIVYVSRKHESQRRQDMVMEMIRTEERERQNLSAQVHDQMSQDLGAIKIYLGIIEQSVANPDAKLKEKLSQSRKIASELIDKTHNISLLLRPPALDELGLAESLEALMIDYNRLTGASYIFDKPQDELRLEPEFSLFLYRLAQETLTNAAKYAQAKNIRIKLAMSGNTLELFYEDDGRGFDYDKFLKQQNRRREDKYKLGILGLKERAELLGGSMRVNSSVGGGTRITVKLFI